LGNCCLAEAKRRWAETLSELPPCDRQLKATVRIFVKKRFGFCPKGTAVKALSGAFLLE